MCDTCGCSQPGESGVTYSKPHHHGDGIFHHHHDHNHPHEHNHDHHHDTASRTIEVEVDVLSKNNRMAERNRGYFEAKNVLALNLVSSPGSGKTTLLERTITDLKNEIHFSVIEGDQQTMNDANRIAALKTPVIQVNTGNGCHLDADMVNRAAKELDLPEHSVLMIENVGNLVCPSLFDLGEFGKVVIISVTEGEDKPIKYPTMFAASTLCLINKMDLAPYVDFDVKKCREYALKVNPNLQFFELSAKTGQGMSEWYQWLKGQLPG